MKERSLKRIGLPVLLACVIITGSFAKESERYEIVGPRVVAQNAAFTAWVLEKTENGLEPPREPLQVVYQGGVYDVDRGGKVKLLQAGAKVGNIATTAVIVATAQSALTKRPAAAVTQNLTVLPKNDARLTAQPQIQQTSGTVYPRGTIAIAGEGLDRLTEYALEGTDGTQIPVLDWVGSEYDIRARLPENCPEQFRVVGRDVEQNRYEAPNPTSTAAPLKLEGERWSHRGEGVSFTVSGEPDAMVYVSGEKPQLNCNRTTLKLDRNGAGTLDCKAAQAGRYTLRARTLTSEEYADETLPPVTAAADTIDASYDPARNETTLNGQLVVQDANGPVAETVVDTVISDGNHVRHTRATTDSRGIARFSETFAGRFTAAASSVVISQVLGRVMRPGTTTSQDDPVQDPKSCDCADLKFGVIPKVTGTLWLKRKLGLDEKGPAEVEAGVYINPKGDGKEFVVVVPYHAEITCTAGPDGEKCTGTIELTGEAKDWPKGKPATRRFLDPDGKEIKKLTFEAPCGESRMYDGFIVFVVSVEGDPPYEGDIPLKFTRNCAKKELDPLETHVYANSNKGGAKQGNRYEPEKSDFDGDGWPDKKDNTPQGEHPPHPKPKK